MLGELEGELDEIAKERIETEREMLKQACRFLGETSTGIIKSCMPGANILVNLSQSFTELFKDGGGSNLPKKMNVTAFEEAGHHVLSFIGIFTGYGPDSDDSPLTIAEKDWKRKIKSRITKVKKEYDNFIYSSFDKLGKYKDLLGKSILLCELIRRFKGKLVPRRIKSGQYKPYPKKPSKPRNKSPGWDPKPGIFYFRDKKRWNEEYDELEREYERKLKKYEKDVRQYELVCSDIKTEAARYYDELEKAFSLV